MKRPTESEIYEQAFEFVSRCGRFTKEPLETEEPRHRHLYRVGNFLIDRPYPKPPLRIFNPRSNLEGCDYHIFGELWIDERRTFWEWLTRKPSEKAQWIQALDAAAALLR